MSIRVLVVEDSVVIRELLHHILSSDPAIQVVGMACDGKEALQAARDLKPDVITMDICLPGMDGYEATRRILETHPAPIVVVSLTVDAKEIATTFRALEAGALAAVQKPMGLGHPDYEETAKALIQTVKLMSEVKVVKRLPSLYRERSSPVVASTAVEDIRCCPGDVEIIAIGASTGGPAVLHTILSGLPGSFPVPILIVQHMSTGFMQGFAASLSEASDMSVEVAAHGEFIVPGRVYLAPDKLHLGVTFGGRIALSSGEPEYGMRPAVSYLFRSVTQAYGRKAVAVLLTGMGKDGAKELLMMKTKGAVTIAQDEASSVVYGMPGEAVRINAATYVLPPARIAASLIGLMERNGRVGYEPQ